MLSVEVKTQVYLANQTVILHPGRTICIGCRMAAKTAARHVGSLVDVETGQRFAVTTEPGPGASYPERWCIMFDSTREKLALETDSLPPAVFYVICRAI